MPFTDVIGDPVAKLIVACEIEKGHRIDGDVWTQEGAPNDDCWWITHAEGEPERVEEDAVPYTERANLADCQANAESWYWDSANTRLYVHTSGSDDPGGGSYIILSFIWERFADKECTISNKPYKGYLDRFSVPPVKLQTGGYHEGGTMQSCGGIRFNSQDGFFDTELTTYIYEKKLIQLIAGLEGDARADYQIFWIGTTGNITWSESVVEMDIEDLRHVVL